MKSRVVLAVLAVMGTLGLTATAAQAGEGGMPFPLTSFFVCQGINGQDSGLNVDVEDSGLGVNPQNVTLGKGLLACVVAKLFHSGDRTTCTGNADCGPGEYCPIPQGSTTGVCEIAPPPAGTDSNGLKCYAVSGQKAPTAPISNTYIIEDDLLGMESGVPATKFQYVCAPATYTFESQ